MCSELSPSFYKGDDFFYSALFAPSIYFKSAISVIAHVYILFFLFRTYFFEPNEDEGRVEVIPR